jgi:BirA family transcriptional regulator, biotin operon repressor / biotin---[acetyl-CoA-carboxylase] ligase
MMIELPRDASLPPFELLHLLADGKMHSGQELGNALGISRTAVWKQLVKLEPLGFELVSYPGRGYCLTGGVDLLSETLISEFISPSVMSRVARIDLLKAVDSTNNYLLKQEPQKKIAVCLAECQTSGRGRRGRSWISPFARNIYLSLKITIDGGFNVIEGLSLAAGVAVVRALREAGVCDVQLKWPNDILWGSRKLGGVLIDVLGDPAGRCHVVIGIGLNVYDDKTMRTAIDQPWVSLSEIVATLQQPLGGRNYLVACILNQVIPLLDEYDRKGFLFYRDEWESLNAHRGQCVEILVGTNVFSGTLLGVNNSGALLLRTQEGEQLFHGGEVTLRGVPSDIGT